MADGAPICSCEEYKREIARLREALDKISDFHTPPFYMDESNHNILTNNLRKIAIETLKEKPLTRG